MNPSLHGLPVLTAGTVLTLSYASPRLGSLSVTGYAYPFIDRQLLRETLPFLSYFIPFTYGVTEQGTLVELDDQELLDTAESYGISSLLHLSSLTEQGNFSSELIGLILGSPALQDVLVEEVVRMLYEKGFAGADVDFEYVPPAAAAQYPLFLEKLHRRLEPLGFLLFSALVPKTSDDQPGAFYEGHLYREIAAASDFVLLMTYEWGYTYGPPMAVAPLPSVRQVLDYAVTRMPREKIYMGIPNYGYDWPLPFVQGETRAESIGNVQAVDIARRYGAAIHYDTYAQAPYFHYADESGRQHEVWFEDARSIDAKLRTAFEYGFQGVGYWNLMRPFPQNWALLDALFYIRQ